MRRIKLTNLKLTIGDIVIADDIEAIAMVDAAGDMLDLLIEKTTWTSSGHLRNTTTTEVSIMQRDTPAAEALRQAARGALAIRRAA